MKFTCALVLFLSLVVPAMAGDYTVETLNQAAPADIADPIRAELSSTGVRVKTGADTLCEIWFRKSIPTAPGGDGIGRSYPNMPDTTLIGAMRVVSKMSDNRDHVFPMGTYVMRHGVQPQDGNHAGSTDYIDFALLLNAKNDRTVDGGYPTSMDMIRRSLADGGVGHPVVFALVPPSGSPAKPSIKKNQNNHWVLETKVGDMPLAMVVVGVYEH